MHVKVSALGLVAASFFWSCSACGLQSTESSNTGAGAMPKTSAMWNAMSADAAGRRDQLSTQRRFRREFFIARSPTELLPKPVDQYLRATLGAPPGSFALGTAQHVRSLSGEIWVIHGKRKGSGITCIVQGADGYVGCTSSSDFAARGLALGMARPSRQGSNRPQDFQLMGIAPDWVKTVQVRVGSRTVWAIPVRGSIYSLRAKAPMFVERFCNRDQWCKRAWVPSHVQSDRTYDRFSRNADSRFARQALDPFRR
jgi:hypothetical protein